jgi:hypothetical protein
VGHLLTEVGLGVPLQLLQNECADLLGAVILIVDPHVPVRAHVALDGADGAFDVCDGLALGDLANQDLAALREGDYRRGRSRTLGVGDDGGLSTFKYGDDGVGGSEVNADCTSHNAFPPAGKLGFVLESVSLNVVLERTRLNYATALNVPGFGISLSSSAVACCPSSHESNDVVD